MDEAKRRELEARRAAHRDRAAEPRPQGAIVRRLARCGIAHTPTDEGIWTPPYLPVTAIRIFWEGAPDPARWDHCETYKQRIDTIRGMIEEVVRPDDLLRFSYDSGFESNFTIRASDALRRPVLSIVLASRRTTWITSYPNLWLIEWGDYHTARLAKPPPDFSEELAARDAAYFAPLTELLQARGVPSVMTPAYNPNGPQPPAVVAKLRMAGWSTLKRSLSRGIEKAGGGPLTHMLALRRTLEPFLAERLAPTAAVVVDLLGRGTPRLQLPWEGLIDNLPGLYRLLHRRGEDAPGGPIETDMVRLYADGEDWLVEIADSGAYISVRGLG
ncbi:MAG: hypothetical protein GW859_02445 [Sphingomonadales bacterium]|nr:hypothetical protein [Sphingomonadales bacterium]